MVAEDGIMSLGTRLQEVRVESMEDCQDWCLTQPHCAAVEWQGGVCSRVDPADPTITQPDTKRRNKHTYDTGECNIYGQSCNTIHSNWKT